MRVLSCVRKVTVFPIIYFRVGIANVGYHGLITVAGENLQGHDDINLSIRFSVGGCVLKRDIIPFREKGMMINM